MNYIPGFSNYLAASVPEYGPAPIVAAEPVAPQRAAVMPMTQEAEAPAAMPYSLSGLSPEALAGLYALSANNAGSSTPSGIAGLPSIGNLGANYADTTGMQLITAPISNKGNPTAYGANNQFYIQPNEFVRVVDRSTNSVIFEGVGPDAAREAVKIGQNLTDTKGRKADYQIQAGLTQDNYQPVANEKFNKSTAGKIAGAVGTALPLAMAFVPGLNLGVLGSIAAGAGIGGASAGLKGDNILKGAAMGGLSAAGGQLLGPALGEAGNIGLRAGTAIGTGLGSTAGGLITGQNLKDALLSGAVSGGLSYLAPDVTKGLGIGGGSSASTSTSGGGGGDIVVSGYRPTSIGTTLGGSQNKIQQALKPKTETPYDGLSVTGNRLGNTFGADLGGDRFGTPGQDTSALDRLTDPADPDDIVVRARQIADATPVSVTGVGGGEITPEYLPKEDIVVDATKIERPVTGGLTLSQDTLADIDKGAAEEAEAKKKLGVKDYIDIATLLAGLIPEGKGGSNSSGSVPAGMGTLSSLFSKQLPTSTLPGGVSGGALPASTLASQGLRSPQDYYRYGYGPEQSFFDYATQGAPNTSRAYTGYEGSTAEDAFAPQPMRAPQVALPQVALPQPITTPIPNTPAGPSMYAPAADDMRFARGGFAVEGAGDGRDDKIPALLSDGEYVIDAETVALLGNGSNKAGAKLLDNFRVKVRKQKGKKLARGEFSDNAKRPEHYMAGGYA